MTGLRPLLAVVLGTLIMAGSNLVASDPPHNISVANSYGSLNYCSTCHKTHDATGGQLTTTSGNANLCLSCHVSGGSASAKALATSDQAVPAGLVGATAGGSSHRWDSGPQGRISKGAPNTSTGTIVPSGAYTGAYASTIQIRISTAGAAGLAKFDWSMTPAGSTTFGTATTGVATSTTATALGSTGVALAFSSTGTFNLNDIFYLYVRAGLSAPSSAAMAGRLENGTIMCSTCHDQHLQTLAPFDPTSSQTYTAGTTNNRHFQRVDNSAGGMCGDCHANRDVGKGGTSHPVHVNRASAPNTKAPSASLVLSIAGNVECLTCHDVHGASGATTPAGMLLRVSNSTALCTDCHTLADTATANTHTNPSSGILWPGDQYGGSTYPAYTLAGDRGACKNCHTPHGWPDASNPNQAYALALGARQDSLCLTCHDGTPAKDVRTQIVKTIHHPVENTTGRLVGCADCHNPHMATAGVRTYATTADLNRNRLRAAAGGVLNNAYALRGVDGIAFNYSGLGMWASTTAANFTKIASGNPATPASGAEFEYQVCFKCHTSYSFGSTPPDGITSGGTSTLTLVAGTTQSWTAGTGTAKFTNGSTTVTGTGTSWTTANMVGQYIRPTGGTVNTYRVTAVASTTSLTISASYGQTTTAVVAYETRDAAAITTTTAVTGYGTSWTSALVGQFFAMTSGNTNAYRITAVPSATSLTIATATTSTTPQDFYIHPGASFTNASKAVVGYGTTWTSALVGSSIQASGQAGTYVIASVQDATHLTLTANYTNTTGIYRYLLAGPIRLVETDLAQEFNPANRSGHPVVTGLNNYTGSIAPKALTVTLSAPWNTNKGSQTMMCSDCHNTDAASPAAQGPHGSAAQFMLRTFAGGAPTANWPNVTLSNARSTTVANQSWCNNCHPMQTSTNNVHTTGDHSSQRCYVCHIIIPHGGKISRLLGNRNSMPVRYAYQNNLTNMQLTNFKKAASTSYLKDSTGNCSAACATGDHPTITGGEGNW